MISALGLSAQHTLTLGSSSDFNTIHNGKIESTFVLDQELSATETANFTEWVSDNVALITVSKNALTVSMTCTPDYNNSKVYNKLFYMLGVDEVKVNVNGSEVEMSLPQFFSHFIL